MALLQKQLDSVWGLPSEAQRSQEVFGLLPTALLITAWPPMDQPPSFLEQWFQEAAAWRGLAHRI